MALSTGVSGTTEGQFAQEVLAPLIPKISFGDDAVHVELLNGERREEMNWIVDGSGGRVAVRLLREMPSPQSLKSDWVGWAKHLAEDRDTALLLVVTQPEPYSASLVRGVIEHLLALECRSSVLNAALGLDCFWLVTEKRVVTVSYGYKG